MPDTAGALVPSLPSFDALFEHAACGLLLTDADGRILRVNATFCLWVGWPAEQLVGDRHVQDFLTMGGKVFHQTHWAPLLQMQGSVGEVKLDVVHRDGHTLPMLFNAVRRRHGETVYDELAAIVVSDRHRYERELLLARQNAENALAAHHEARRELQTSRDVLSLAMRSGRMGAWSRDIASDEVWWSRELEELLGLPEHGFAGTKDAFRHFVHHEDLPALARAVEQAVANRTDYIVEFRFRHSSGEWRWMEGRGRAVYDEKGKAVTLHGLGIDITDRKLAEEDLRRLTNELSHADRRKDEFLATLSHELRNPLAPMRNVLEILRLKNVDDPQLRWARDVLERQLQQLTHLVDDLLEVARITQGKLELRRLRIELADAMRVAVEAAAPLMQASSHQLTVNAPSQPVFLNADPTRITQVILNLLNNAAKYTPAKGQIWLRAEQQGDDAVISVRDSGIGIPRAQLAGVFEMFSQLAPALDRSQGGLGIGLALVKGLVELHGGTVSAHSDGPGQGSEFIIRMPVCTLREAAPAHPHTEPAAASRSSSRRVLIVDDNEDAATTLAVIVKMQGHEVRTAHDGLSALQLARDFAPHVVLLDIGLPHFNGYEVARRIRQEPWGQGIVLVALTGWGQEQDKLQSAQAGFDRHMTKPVEPSELETVFLYDKRAGY